MRICIVDDEPEAVRSLHDMLAHSATKLHLSPVIEEFTDSTAFLNAFAPGRYAIVFLDIYIDSASGLDLARQIRRASENTMIVFVTTSRENMPEAFRFHAFDYIVKPVTEQRMDALLADALKVLPKLNRYLVFTANRQEVRLLFSDFLWTQSQGHYLHIRDRRGGDYTARMTTKEFLGLTDGDARFLAVNKGIVVNMDHIKTIRDGVCTMTDDSVFPIKVREAAKIEQQWQNYMFDSLREGQGKP